VDWICDDFRPIGHVIAAQRTNYYERTDNCSLTLSLTETSMMKITCWFILLLCAAGLYAQVTSVNSLTGAITFLAGNFTTVAVVGQTVTYDLNTTTALSKVGAQAGAYALCPDSNGSSTIYVCTTNPVLLSGTSLVVGTQILFRPGTTNTGACTVDVDGAGPIGVASIKKADGTTDPGSGTIIANEFYRLTYDGTVWRLQQGYAST
jgi:hypothetical protein